MSVRRLAVYFGGMIVGWFLGDLLFGGMHRVQHIWAPQIAGIFVAVALIWVIQRFRSTAS